MTETGISVSIITPTYNRANTLPRLYHSILGNSKLGIEWVVVDDGSGDDTQALIKTYQRQNEVSINYIRKENGGRHTAINTGVEHSNGAFAMIMDSDDWLLPGGLEGLLQVWDSIGHDDSYGAVTGNCLDHNGHLIGSRIPSDSMDADFVTIRAVHRVKGDKKELLRTSVLREFPFPEFPGEKRVPTSLVLLRISSKYRSRFVNVDVCAKEYRQDGITANLSKISVSSALGSRLNCAEHASYAKAPLSYRLRNAAHFVRFSLHSRRQQKASPVSSPRLLVVLAYPLGCALYARDRWTAKRP
jgi:glycosyltransferase involved in cell wall biosynthesis